MSGSYYMPRICRLVVFTLLCALCAAGCASCGKKLPAVKTGSDLLISREPVRWSETGEEVFSQDSSEWGLGGFVAESFEADLNGDEHYEVYVNAVLGSGIAHAYVKGIDIVGGKEYLLSERMKNDYAFIVYSEELYIVQTPFAGDTHTVYRPSLGDDSFLLDTIDDPLQEKILKDCLDNR